MKIVAGVDGGATHTRLVLADVTGNILGFGVSGPSNYGSVSLEKIGINIQNAFMQAFNQTNLTEMKIDSIFLGLAGVISSDDRNKIHRLVKSINGISIDNIGVDHDIRISLAGGLAGAEGIALIVGTGSSCYGRTINGNDWMAGGWGHILDDRGSAYDLARSGLTAVVRAADGRGPDTFLTEKYLKKLGIDETHKILSRIYVDGPSGKPMDKKEIASLADLVTDAAQKGDHVAIQIVRDGVKELLLMIETVANKLDFKSDPISLVISGGTVGGSTFLKKEILEAIDSSLPIIRIEKSVLSPLKGSLLLSLQMAGIEVDRKVIKRLKVTAFTQDDKSDLNN